MKPARILVVEDEVIVSLDIRDRLTLLGYEISGVFSRGEDVLAELENHRPDLVLMDIRLKGALDGIAVADQVRQRWRLPVVYLTAYAEDTTLQRAKVTEPFGYIVKPFEDREIKSVIEMALYKHQAEERLRQSERRYATTLRSIGDGVIATDPEGRVTFMNRVAETLTGWSIAQAQGRPLGEIFRIISESNRQPVEDAIARALREKAVVSLPSHTILIDREGHETPIDDGAAPILDDEGAVTGAVLVFQDVSSHRQQERSLRQSEAQFRLVWESSIDGLRLLDHRGIMLRVNQAFCELTGKSREELEGQSLATIYEAEQGKHALEQYLNRYANKTLDRYVERKLRLWNGKEVWFAVTNSLLNPDGDQPAILSVFRDVTERKLVEESLRMRVLALTQPLDDPSSFQFSDLFNIQDIQRIQDAFANATGVASIITHPDGTPITRPSNFCRLCNEVIRKTPKGLANCYKSDAVLGSYNPSGPVVQTCLSGGLWDAGASISVGGKHVANWLIGQVRNEAQDDIQMLKYADEIGADREQFQQALAEVPVMSREQFIKVAQALFCFANELSLKAFQNAQQARFIADRQRAAEALEVSEARFRKLLESTPNVAVQGFGPEGLVTYWNQASTTLYGYTAEEALDKNLLDLVVPNETRNAVLSVIRSMAETGESHPPVEWLLRRKNGSQV
ncbi:MAG TPA: PAS domain S-box protein, partial [Candidatus Paceibacterota bacterium]|nr:PAS domain S-box protein [Candidatus Paceibacterota bacterium]